MERIMNAENLRSFAYVNDEKIKGEIKGIIVFFVGLGGSSMYNDGNPWADSFAENGVLFVIPYHNPWAWMNKHTVDFTDEIIDVLFEKYSLADDTPVVSCGGSMGGLSALVYTAYSKRTPASCVASCPVCDLPYHFTERVDLPRTLYTAFMSYDGSLDDALRSASPLHLVDKMPVSTDYTVFHCDKDTAVNIEKHSNRFVEQMKKEHDITYYVIPDRGHCDLGDEMNAFYDELLLKRALKQK